MLIGSRKLTLIYKTIKFGWNRAMNFRLNSIKQFSGTFAILWHLSEWNPKWSCLIRHGIIGQRFDRSVSRPQWKTIQNYKVKVLYSHPIPNPIVLVFIIQKRNVNNFNVDFLYMRNIQNLLICWHNNTSHGLTQMYDSLNFSERITVLLNWILSSFQVLFLLLMSMWHNYAILIKSINLT